jgi:hypothetical protein
VVIIGLKLVVDWGFNSETHPHRVNFHNVRAPEFWIFWLAMIACFVIGFIPKKKRPGADDPTRVVASEPKA